MIAMTVFDRGNCKHRENIDNQCDKAIVVRDWVTATKRRS